MATRRKKKTTRRKRPTNKIVQISAGSANLPAFIEGFESVPGIYVLTEKDELFFWDWSEEMWLQIPSVEKYEQNYENEDEDDEDEDDED